MINRSIIRSSMELLLNLYSPFALSLVFRSVEYATVRFTDKEHIESIGRYSDFNASGEAPFHKNRQKKL